MIFQFLYFHLTKLFTDFYVYKYSHKKQFINFIVLAKKDEISSWKAEKI